MSEPIFAWRNIRVEAVGSEAAVNASVRAFDSARARFESALMKMAGLRKNLPASVMANLFREACWAEGAMFVPEWRVSQIAWKADVVMSTTCSHITGRPFARVRNKSDQEPDKSKARKERVSKFGQFQIQTELAGADSTLKASARLPEHRDIERMFNFLNKALVNTQGLIWIDRIGFHIGSDGKNKLPKVA